MKNTKCLHALPARQETQTVQLIIFSTDLTDLLGSLSVMASISLNNLRVIFSSEESSKNPNQYSMPFINFAGSELRHAFALLIDSGQLTVVFAQNISLETNNVHNLNIKHNIRYNNHILLKTIMYIINQQANLALPGIKHMLYFSTFC